MQSVESFPWVVGAFFSFIVLLMFSFAGIYLVRKTIGPKKLQAHHDVAGFVFANLGVLYAVLLGFTVVNVQARYDKIKENLQLEAGYLADLYRDAEVFASEDKTKIQEAIKHYTLSVIEREWGKSIKTTGLKPSPELQSIWNAYYDTSLKDAKQASWYKESISKLNLLMTSRIFRLLGGEESLKPEMWTILLLGGISILSFTWLFGLENLTSHFLIVTYLAATTAGLLFLIYSLDTAFTGKISIPPDTLVDVMHMFD